VTKFKPDGSGLLYSTYLGGSGTDQGNGVAVDASGQAYVTGYTTSSNFPTTAGAYATTLSGTQDAFVVRLSAAGSALGYATFAGRRHNRRQRHRCGPKCRAYVTGSTTASSFPTTTGAYQLTWRDAERLCDTAEQHRLGVGLFDVFGRRLQRRRQRHRRRRRQQRLPDGFHHLVQFSDHDGAYQTGYGGGGDAFVARLNDGGGSLGFSTFLGGSGADQGNGVAVDADANVILVGQTASTNFPTLAPFQSANGGANDAFVAKFAQLVPPVFTSISPDTGSPATRSRPRRT